MASRDLASPLGLQLEQKLEQTYAGSSVAETVINLTRLLGPWALGQWIHNFVDVQVRLRLVWLKHSSGK